MKTAPLIMIATVILFLTCSAKAELVELSLPCAGLYDETTPPWTMDFDLGVTFTDISHVYIDWSGEITGGLATDPYTPGDPFPIDVEIGAHLGDPPNWRHTTVAAGAATYPEPEAFAVQSEFVAGTMPWSELFDGQGTITVEYLELLIPGTYVEHGSIVLAQAILVVDGTVVPEPATVLLLAIGGLCVRPKSGREQRRTRGLNQP